MPLVTISTDPNRKLSVSAGGSYFRMRKAGLPKGGINSAYRSTASQDLIFRSRYRRVSYKTSIWYDGSYWVHVSGLPVAVPGTSDHNKGNAIDVTVYSPQFNWLVVNGGYHGWARPLPVSDPVHWVYTRANDQDYADLVKARAQVRGIQRIIRVPESGVNDAATAKAATSVRSANKVPADFPYGVKTAQYHSNAVPDGVWGEESKKDNIATVKRIQAVLGVTESGNWNVETDRAWKNTKEKAE